MEPENGGFFGASLQKWGTDASAASFQAGEPYPHIVIDDFLPERSLATIVDNFPPPSAGWQHFNNPRERKFALSDESAMPSAIRHALREFNSAEFLEFLEKVTGIDGLIPDPYLFGGGMHQITAGGVLKIHADFSIHERLKLHRRLNVLLYLNDDWDDAWGGHFELWDEEMSHAVKRLAPIANRMVTFATTSTSFHGHPDPLATPEGRFRRSLALYYYTAPEDTSAVRGHSTLFQARPSDSLVSRDPVDMARLLLPPLALDAARDVRKRWRKRRSS